jgi:hypothetical protein
MGKRDEPVVESDETTAAGVQSTRQRRTDSLDAAVLVDDVDGTREVRMVDFLGELTDDTESFERVGAMRIGEEVQVYRGSGPSITVRRIR